MAGLGAWEGGPAWSAIQLQAVHESWPLAEAFTISRGSKTSAEVVVVTLTATGPDGQGLRGQGECVPYGRYGETVEGVLAALQALPSADPAALPAGAARNALDCALWDLRAKWSGQSVAALLGLTAPQAIETAETISLGTPQAMAAKAKRLAGRPLLKVKVGGDDPLARLQAVRAEAPTPRLIVDANEGWTFDQLRALLPDLAALRCDLIEQPLPADQDAALADLGRPAVDLCADESVHARDGLERLRALYQVVNIKLDKTGGLTEALALKAAAQEAGFGIMVGCMVGTSLAMAPAHLVAQGVAFADLDGPLMLRQDRAAGMAFNHGVIGSPSSTLWG
jgi:L-alanine-DL-glutamate epimerase-like enolase superfamily enzyme